MSRNEPTVLKVWPVTSRINGKPKILYISTLDKQIRELNSFNNFSDFEEYKESKEFDTVVYFDNHNKVIETEKLDEPIQKPIKVKKEKRLNDILSSCEEHIGQNEFNIGAEKLEKYIQKKLNDGKNDNELATAYLLLVECYYRARKFESVPCIEVFDPDVCKITVGNSSFKNRNGISLMMMVAASAFANKDYEFADRAYEKVLEFDPGFTMAELLKADSLFRMQDYEKAKNSYDSLGKKMHLLPEREHSSLFVKRGACLEQMGFLNQAKDDFERSYELDKSDGVLELIENIERKISNQPIR